jgi:hypothetical protein
VKAAFFVLFGLLAGATSVDAQEVQTVLVLRGPGALAAEDERLVEALRIYTRDRDCRLVVEGEAPATLDGRATGAIVARARRSGAALVVWVGRRADGRAVYYVLTAASADLRETEIAPLGPARTAVDVALKVRALLALPLARADGEKAGSPGASPAPAAPGSLAAPAPAAPAPEVTPPTLVARAAPPPAQEESPAPPERFALGVGYGVFLPTDPSWVRQGLVVGVEARVGRIAGAPLSLAADAALLNRPERTVRGFDVALGDVPLGVNALVRGRWGRVGAACGPRLGVHVLDVMAIAQDGRSGSSRRYALGIGGRFEADLRLFTYMKVYLRATVEGLVPKQEFTLAAQPALSTGSLLVGGTAGVTLLIL